MSKYPYEATGDATRVVVNTGYAQPIPEGSPLLELVAELEDGLKLLTERGKRLETIHSKLQQFVQEGRVKAAWIEPEDAGSMTLVFETNKQQIFGHTL